ncbi:MAG: hypothetical protein J0L92_29615 [Deltaproteobacteria bacterium]|nr:hypothetical protein [Deltaproteobacteria bacterium]
MELKLNLGILCLLGAVWASLTITEESAALDPALDSTRELSALEDRFATHRDDAALAEELADAYLRLDRPELAVSALMSADEDVLADPAVAHRLARGYERTGRVEDALSTAQLALARCARALGVEGSSEATPVPAHGCSERTYAALDVHQTALSRMHAWGVTDPRTDARADRAYGMAVRAARLVSASAE